MMYLNIFLPPFLAGILVLATHVPLGKRVIQRGIIFVDLAIAQIAALGVIIAQVIGWNTAPWQIQMIALIAALLGGWILYLGERRWPQQQEAFIGISFVLAATAGILLLSHDPTASEHLQDILAGQILWLNYDQLLPATVIYALILFIWHSFTWSRSSVAFYLIFAVAITLSVQLIGVYLVFASLIIPAFATKRLTYPVFWGYIIGIAGYLAGLILSTLLDLPTGPTIIWTLALCAIAFNLIFRFMNVSRVDGVDNV